MTAGKGRIVLMGSGELTSTMVGVHKQMLSLKEGSPKAVFLDTPAGFQLNADEISKRVLTLPLYPDLSLEDQDFVIDSIKNII